MFCQNEEFYSMIKLIEMKEHEKSYVMCKTDMAFYLEFKRNSYQGHNRKMGKGI